MKRSKDNSAQILSQVLDRFFSPSRQQIESAAERVFERLQSGSPEVSEQAILRSDTISMRRRQRNVAVVFAGVALFLVVALSAILIRTNDTNVIAKTADGREYRAGEIFRSNGAQGTMVTLSDGSRVEMRSKSEAAIERASDGLRIRLNSGSIIVNAAKQTAGGHLYVQTKDVTVSVVGTVFLVNAADDGSSVTVIEGEVRVRQGETERSLQPGEQVSTNKNLETIALQEEIGWSREAAAYLALLHQALAQSLAARQAPARAAPVSGKPRYEEASIRPCPQEFAASEGARGGGSNSLRVSPGRLDVLCMTAATLVRTAYSPLRNNSVGPGGFDPPPMLNETGGFGVEDGTRVRGGPDWARSEKYTIAAVAEVPADARTLQGPMLLDLLERRFQLKAHIATEEIPVLALTIAKGGLKMKRADRGDCVQHEFGSFGPAFELEVHQLVDAFRHGAKPWCGIGTFIAGPNIVEIGGGASVRQLTGHISMTSAVTDGRLIVDRTGIPETNLFNFVIEYMREEMLPDGPQLPPIEPSDIPLGPSMSKALEELGLHLEGAKAPREFIVIDRIERPSPN